MFLFFLFFFLIFFSKIESKSTPAQTTLTVIRVGPCFNTKNFTVTVSELAIHKEMYHSTFSGFIDIAEDIENGWYLKATMQKCHDIRNIDTCDLYKSVVVAKDGCEQDDDKTVYSMFFQFVTPKIECPIRAGHYTITDFPFYTDDTRLTAMESKISTSMFGYTYKLEAINDESKLFCAEAYLRMMYIRKHDWVGDQKVHSYFTDVTEPEGTTETLTDVDEEYTD